MSQQSVRSIFISDVHLGTSACQASLLLDFLESTRCETLYLVGDIIDLLAMRKRVQYTSDHQAIIVQVFKMTQSGTRVVYIPGNHDALFWRFHGQEISGVEIKRNIDYTSLDGRTFLVSHGDEFDTVMQCSPWLNWLGDVSHELLFEAKHCREYHTQKLGAPLLVDRESNQKAYRLCPSIYQQI